MPAPLGLKATARLTGLAYLGLAVSGAVGFLFVRSQLYVPGDAAATAANLTQHQLLARVGLAADLAVVLTQALTALGFFRLFRAFDSFAAAAIAAFGLVNAVIVLVGAMFSSAALGVAANGAATTLVLYELTGAAWSLGGLFFGLWLIPMGWLAWRSGRMPRALGWTLMVGGVGYIVSTFVAALAPAASTLTQALPMPATIGEFWMIGFLLIRGVADDAPGPHAAAAV
jgi:Domain of unknown function (DUF4386)